MAKNQRKQTRHPSPARTARRNEQEYRANTIDDIKNLDAAVNQLLKQNMSTIMGADDSAELSSIYDEYTSLVKMDSYNFMKNKNSAVNTYSYLSNALLGRRPDMSKVDKNGKPLINPMSEIEARTNLEKIFQEGDSQAAAMFLNRSSDIVNICDEIESVCAYLYQLDNAIDILSANILNTEQSLAKLPFDVEFANAVNDSQEYKNIFQDAVRESGIANKLRRHIVPKTLKFGRYFVMTIPYSEIGVKLIQSNSAHTRNIFNFFGNGVGGLVGGQTGGYTGIGDNFTLANESVEAVTESFNACMENVNIVLDNLFSDESINLLRAAGIKSSKEELTSIIEGNIKGLLVNEEDTPPNITGITESSKLYEAPEELQKLIEKALKNADKSGNGKMPTIKRGEKNEDKSIADATIDPNTLKEIPGCFIQLVDPRKMCPIVIMDHTIGYYYFENYDYARVGTSLTDLLSNQINFNDQNLIVDNIVGAVLKNLKYGDLLNGNNDFKSLILNCVLYAERRQNPVRLKFVPVEYVTEFKTNTDEVGNGQSVLTKSVVWGRMYCSLLIFLMTSLITKSTDTEFYYLKEGLLTSSYEDQVADLIEQFRNSSVDISQILNGNLMHGNRAINKRYFMCTGMSDEKPVNMEVVSGQQIDLHMDFLTDLKKMAIGASGVPAVATEYMEDVEFATIIKMSNTKVLTESNEIQDDINPSITALCKKIVRYCKPNAIPEEILETAECKLRPNNTINNNIGAEEINNTNATADNMIEVFFKGQNTETPESMEYIKEEMRKRMVMYLSPSLPWGHMEEILPSVVAAAKVQQVQNKLLQDNQNSSEGE